MTCRLPAACLALGIAAILPAPGLRASQPERVRLIIETDAGGDPDDEQSLVRFLLYADEFDVEGIIANRPRARDGENRNSERTGLGIVRRTVGAYGACWPRLREHDPRYPGPDVLLSRTVAGYGGDDGVRLVLRAVDGPDPRPVWFLNWGTDRESAESCLKRALDRVLRERGPKGYASFKARIRLSSADRFGDHVSRIGPPFPLWVDTFRPDEGGRRWYHRFSALTARADGFDVERDVRSGHGPLGALYPTNTTHPQKEGDTMTFLYLVPTGMNDPAHPSWGSWAGRYGRKNSGGFPTYFHASQRDEWHGTTTRDNTLLRWAVDLQNDFRARLDWCVKPYAQANHPPVVRLDGEPRRTVRSGDAVLLDAGKSTDPDRQPLRYDWFIYREAGTCGCAPSLYDANAPLATLRLEPSCPACTIHAIVAVRDGGEPPLARYARVVLDVKPKSP